MESTEGELVLGVINLHNKIQKRVGGALSIHGLGLSEFLVLNELSKAAGNRMRRVDLAERVGLSPSGVTRLLNPMEKVGLIQKEDNPRDARVSLVVLSATGNRIFEEASVSFEHVSASLFEPIKSKGHASLTKLIEAIM